jgi:putative protease
MPMEVFVHGALCDSYSGQCLTSESWGGRSVNRWNVRRSTVCRMT